MLDIAAIRREFPALSSANSAAARVHLDNAATTYQPRHVIDTVSDYYEHARSPNDAYVLYVEARRRIARGTGAAHPEEVVFCASATHAIHLVAHGWGDANIGSDDEIVVSSAEHVANFASWQALAQRRGARLRVIPVDATGALPLEALQRILSKRTKLVAIAHVSNVMGAVFPVREIVAATHDVGARVLIDGAQAVSRLPVGFDELDADFYAFSGHKAFAPTGIGVLLARRDLLDEMQPVLSGANAFDAFASDECKLAAAPGRFEGGTANIAGAIALAEALEFVERLGRTEIADHERGLRQQFDAGLARIKGVSILGSGSGAAICAFIVAGRDSGEIQRRLGDHAIDIRAGHLSAQTLLRQFGADSALRASATIYNNENDIDRFLAALTAIVR
jgi:cysteine desulfurase/selenocysteine lyase